MGGTSFFQSSFPLGQGGKLLRNPVDFAGIAAAACLQILQLGLWIEVIASVAKKESTYSDGIKNLKQH